VRIAVVVPNWNGRRWLPGCLESLAAQTRPADEVVIVDNGSTDGSVELLGGLVLPLRVIALGRNTGFAAAVNRGIAAVSADAVALVNTDVVLRQDWIERMGAVLEADAGLYGVACKMLQLDDPSFIYDAGDFLRRDGVCEQRGRYELDRGQYDDPGEAFAPCAGAGLYRRSAVLGAGGFDERLFLYLEDVDLGLRLRLAGWRCAYEPVVALHAGGGSSTALDPPIEHWVERNTLLLLLKAFPPRWAPFVAYRQLATAWHASREGWLRTHVEGMVAALPLAPAMLRERRRLYSEAALSIGEVVPRRPLRGLPRAPAATR
jgi:GT2 family glycosyltransferase